MIRRPYATRCSAPATSRHCSRTGQELIGVSNLLGLFGRASLWGLGGVALGSVVGLAVMLLIVSILPECRSGGDEGACAMGIPVGMAEMGALGGAFAFLLTLLRGGYRLYRIWRAG